jgi:hypothetical protein
MEATMSSNLMELESDLENEIRELELQKARHDGQLEEKRRLLMKLRQIDNREAVPVEAYPTRPGNGFDGGRKRITDLGKHHYEVGGERYRYPGQVLDHFNAPHYFSRKHPKKGDAASREILRWAKRNPSLASTVSVVLADGTNMDLHTAVTRIWP